MNFLAGCIHFILACILTVHGFDFDECPSKESSSLDVKYGSMSVVCDRNYPKDLVTSTPEIKFSFADVNKYYEVLMFDPDAPSAMNPKSQNIPKCQSWLHLYLSDVKGSELKKGFLANDGTSDWNVITDYNPPAPPKESIPDARVMFRTRTE
ncbi:phosphatidylethanolamine-binding protein 4-like [Xenia sp. Carnegie-2017]|uniref:phosphatidylethanolamine-binding protein 4-like n=1 Tax=Xenia sp. Carnegie-2017 TaxID=2897299 RepID=UPI001F0429EC|nr:phosphatidylethanolamine-binding protein 4-like [Xenia sp. Carnegie-2017]